MNPVKIRKWYHALLSGNYTQVRGRLCTPDGKCCLGVYLEEVGGGKWVKVPETTTLLRYEDATGAHHSYSLPLDGDNIFRASDPSLKIPVDLRGKAVGSETALATELNDDYNFTFQEIAACIKETWPEAFEEEL